VGKQENRDFLCTAVLRAAFYLQPLAALVISQVVEKKGSKAIFFSQITSLILV